MKKSRFANKTQHSDAKTFFDSSEDNDSLRLPSLSSPTVSVPAVVAPDGAAADDEHDPLDDFMANINEQVEQQNSVPAAQEPLPEIVSGLDEGEFDGYGAVTNISNNNGRPDVEDIDEVLAGGNNLKPDGKARIEPLPAIDHSTVDYAPFQKNFYKEHSEITAMTEEEVRQYRSDIEVHVTPFHASRPIKTFRHAGFDSKLLKEIEGVGFEIPTAIQAQAIPLVMSGKDLIGLAKTGSGKTFAFVWPIIVHILAQPQMKEGDGPIALILVPTRELATQIYHETKRFAKVYNIRCCAIFGGAGKWEMTKAIKESPEIVIATPGRFIEMVRMKATNLRRCTIAVLDEADRMFEMGFEYQMRSIINNIRPDRQLLMFSATMKKKIEGFARELLRDEVRIVVGTIGQANADIKQVVELVNNDDEKWKWLSSNIDEFCADGKVLIFVLSKAGTEELALRMKQLFISRQLDVSVDCLHGDKDQGERTDIMQRFSRVEHAGSNKSTLTVLIATDIASRGLDVKDVRTVVNYDVAKNIETYVHRIGRTGRMGVEGVTPGTAHTLLTPKDSSFAVDLVHNLHLSRQHIAPGLQRLAEADPKWSRIKSHIHSHFSGSSGGKAGLGSGGAPKAYTSAGLAAAAGLKTSTPANVSLPPTLQLSLQQAQERAKVIAASIATAESSQPKPAVKRKSRFSALNPATEDEPTTKRTTTQQYKTGTSLPGFVPASKSDK